MLDAGELRADTLTFTCQTEDGEFFLVRHFDGEEVVMMRATTGIGHAFTTRRMYFQDGELFFAWWQDEQFSPAEPPEGAGEELGWRSSYTETRYYVEGEKVIRQLTKTYEEASWNDNLASEAIPNQPVDVPPGTPYPDLDDLENWKAGEVDC